MSKMPNASLNSTRYPIIRFGPTTRCSCEFIRQLINTLLPTCCTRKAGSIIYIDDGYVSDSSESPPVCLSDSDDDDD